MEKEDTLSPSETLLCPTVKNIVEEHDREEAAINTPWNERILENFKNMRKIESVSSDQSMYVKTLEPLLNLCGEDKSSRGRSRERSQVTVEKDASGVVEIKH